MDAVGADLVVTDFNFAFTSDVEETCDNGEVASDKVGDVADKTVGNEAAGDLVVLDAAFPLITIHFLSLQHCFRTPGPPLPLLSLQ